MRSTGTTHPHLLVIDDDPAIRDVFCTLLREEGYRVTAVAAPFADPNGFLRLAPDLIVLDLVLDGRMVGLDVLAALKADPRTAPIPVLVCTASHRLDEHIRSRLTDWGCEVITKPFDIDAVLAAIDRCLGGDAPSVMSA